MLENTPNTLVCHGLQNTAASFGGGILAQYALYIATRTRHNGNKAFYGAGALKLYSAAGGLLPARFLRPSCLPGWPVAHRPPRACTAASWQGTGKLPGQLRVHLCGLSWPCWYSSTGHLQDCEVVGNYAPYGAGIEAAQIQNSSVPTPTVVNVTVSAAAPAAPRGRPLHAMPACRCRAPPAAYTSGCVA